MKPPILTLLVLQWWLRYNFSLHYQYNIKQTSNKNKEKYQKGDYRGLLVDSIPNSPT